MTSPLAFLLQHLLEIPRTASAHSGALHRLIPYRLMKTAPSLGEVPEHLSLMRFAPKGALDCICAEHSAVGSQAQVECMDRRQACRTCGGIPTARISRFTDELSKQDIARRVDNLRRETLVKV